MNWELEPQVPRSSCVASQGHHPAVHLVERLEARHCQALEGEKRANIGGAISVHIILKKKQKKNLYRSDSQLRTVLPPRR